MLFWTNNIAKRLHHINISEITYRIIAENSKASMSTVDRKNSGLEIRRPNVLISECYYLRAPEDNCLMYLQSELSHFVTCSWKVAWNMWAVPITCRIVSLKELDSWRTTSRRCQCPLLSGKQMPSQHCPSSLTSPAFLLSLELGHMTTFWCKEAREAGNRIEKTWLALTKGSQTFSVHSSLGVSVIFSWCQKK